MINENNIQWSGNNVPISVVARIMKKDEQFVRLALQQKIFPFGVALKKSSSSQFDYYVSPKLLYEYTGFAYLGE